MATATRLGSAIVAVLIAICLSSAVVAAAGRPGMRPEELPNPHLQRDSICGGRGRDSAICDPYHYLSRQERTDIDRSIRELSRYRGCVESHDVRGDVPESTAAVLGYDIGVVVLRHMADDEDDVAVRAARYAQTLLDAWELGHDCENGVLILIALRDKRMHIATGSRARETLTDESVGGIVDHMIPYLKRGRTHSAIHQALVDISATIPKTHFGSGLPADYHDDDDSGANERSRKSHKRFYPFLNNFPMWVTMDLISMAVTLAIFTLVAVYNTYVKKTPEVLAREERAHLAQLAESEQPIVDSTQLGASGSF